MRPELHKPPSVPDTLTPGDQLLAAGLGVGAAAGGLLWASGQLAGLVFSHTWLHLDPTDVARVLWQLPRHLGDPAMAWPAPAQKVLPGPAGMYGAFTATTAAAAGAAGGPADLAELDRQRRAIQRQAPDADWRARAACAEVADPDLFFPDRSEAWKATRARAICAGCVVQPACLHEALTGPQAAGGDQAGIFGGTSPQQRLRLRGRAPIATPTRFLTDPTAAADALTLARQVGVVRAAGELGVSTAALYHAFDRHGLGRPAGWRGSPHSRVLSDRHAAEQVFQRARAVGITRAAAEAGVSHRTLRKAWQRHGLGLPQRAAPQQRGASSLDRAFLGLPGNEAFARPGRAAGAALWARARRLEELETLGARVVYEATTENRARPQTRVWRVANRARDAIERQPAAATDPAAIRARRAERLQAAQAQRRATRAREQAARTSRPVAQRRRRAAGAEERER